MIRKLVFAVVVAVAFLSVCAMGVQAHCDALDGPVVRAAQKALETADLNPLLMWVPVQSEAELREAFAQARAVRQLNAQARELADRYFFETAVRIHRAGEGEPYTGLKAAGQGITPAMRAADQALEDGNLVKLEALLIEGIRHELRQRFAHAVEKKKRSETSVTAGREFVHAYVQFFHLVEAAERATTGKGHRE